MARKCIASAARRRRWLQSRAMDETAINATPPPWPDCGSTNWRWRPRRFYELLFTSLRWYVDAIVGGIFGATRSTVPGSVLPDRTNQGRLAGLEYAQARKVYETRVGTTTASLFWKCRTCGKRGQMFDDVDELLAQRGRLEG